MGIRRPVVDRGQQTRRWGERRDGEKNDDASKGQVSDQYGKIGGQGRSKCSMDIPVYGAIHDLFPNLDSVVLSIDFG